MRADLPLIWDFSQVLARRLLLWAALSIAGGIALLLAQGATGWRTTFWGGFGVQAVLWGAIDAAIAGFGLRNTGQSIRRAEGQPRAAVDAQAEKDARNLRRLLWINTGLDVVYIAGGLAWALTRGAQDPFAAGTGWGIVVQGAFLFVFDLLHARAVPAGEAVLPDLNLFTGAEHQPFALNGEKPAAVLVHGFGGTPAEMRALGEDLHAAGWAVEAVLLPGFGAELATLPERSYAEWMQAVRGAADRLRGGGHAPLMLVGYSMGSAVSLAVAPDVRPDGLALLAPFWWEEKRWMRAVGGALKPFLPASFKPLKSANFQDPRIREGVSKFLPGANLEDPEVQEGIRNLRFPLRLIEQVRDLSQEAFAAAARLDIPVLLVQGKADPVVRTAATHRLAAQFPAGVRYVEVDAAHDLTVREGPAWPEVSGAVAQFAGEVAALQSSS